MSKRKLKAKQILVAILCAASMQVWSAPPVWSAQSVGDAAVSGQIDKKAKTADAANKDAEESEEEKAAAEAETAAGENSVPTIGSYSISPRLAGASTYADGTVGNITVTGGAMTGVVSINGVDIETDSSLESLIIGTGVFNNMYEITQSTAFGNKVNVIDAHASVFGYNAKGWGPAVTVMGWMAAASGDNAVAIGAESVVSAGHNNSVAIGAKSSTSAANQVAFGDLSNPFVTTSYRSLAGIKDISLLGKINDVSIGNGGINGAAINADGNNLSIGVSASVTNSGGGGTAFGNSTVITNANSSIFGALAQAQADNTTAIGYSAYANGDKSTALGANASSLGQGSMALGSGATVAAEHRKSIAIGYGSKTSDSNQVAFGDMTNPSSFRSLRGITNIHMTGTIYADGIANLSRINDAFYSVARGSYSLVLGNLTDDGVLSGATIFGVTGNVKGTGVSVFGGQANVRGNNSSAFGNEARVGGDNSSVFGAGAGTIMNSTNNSAFGTQAIVASSNSSSFGYKALVENNADGSLALGASSTVKSGHTGSVAIGSGSKTSAANQVVFGDMTTPTSFRSLAGIKDIALTGAITGATSISGIDIDSNRNLTNVGTINGVDVTKLSGADFTNIQSDIAVKNTGNTTIFSVDRNTGNVTASGTVTANEFVEGTTKLVDKYAGKSDFNTLNNTVTAANTGLVDQTAALKTNKADKTYVDSNFAKSTDVYTKTEVNTQLGNKANADASGLTDTNKTAWKTALGVDTLETTLTDISYNNLTSTTTVGGVNFAAGGVVTNVASINGIRIDSSGNLTNAGTYNGATIDSKTFNGVDVEALKTTVDKLESSGGGGGGGSSQNTAGIKRTDANSDGTDDTTTIENATSFTTNGMKTSNLQAATAAIGGVNFGGSGALNNVASINGISFAGSKIGGVDLSGGKVDGVSISSLNNRVSALENSGGSGGGGGGSTGGGANTEGITRPDNSHTTIEGNTTIGADGVDTNDLTASGSITVAKGETNQTVIDKNGIHVGKNSSVVNDTDGFITDKGLYIGVESSSNLGSAKFSVAPNGNLSSTAGNYGFSNTSTDGAKFTDTGSIAHGGGSVMDTTIKGNTVETGRIDTDELWVGGNKVDLQGTTVQPGAYINNHLEGNDASGNAVTNDFTTSALNGTTQSAEKESADGKNTIKTTNNTSATGTSNTTTKTDVDGSDNTTVQKSELTTNENGMKLNTSNTVTDKDGNKTSSSSGETTMTGDSLTVSKTTTTKDADGNDVTKTTSTKVDSGEVTLNREDGSSIRVGDAIEGLQSDVQELGGRINEMGVEIKEVGALSAALAGLHPQPQNANTKADFAMAMGSYEGKQALAVGAFYRPDKRVMLSMGASTTSSKHMMNMGISIALDRMPEAERKAQEAGTADNETLNKVLERLEKLELENQKLSAENKKRDADYEKLAGDYAELKEKYAEEKTAE